MIFINHPLHGRMIAKEAGCFFNQEHDHVFSREVDGKLLGGVIFQDYTGRSISMHVAGFTKKWINRDLLWVTFHYPFVQLECSKLIAGLRSSNYKGLEFCLKVGFTEEARVKEVYLDGDLVVLAMAREDCRWLRVKPRELQTG